jgi:hypothetical protein
MRIQAAKKSKAAGGTDCSLESTILRTPLIACTFLVATLVVAQGKEKFLEQPLFTTSSVAAEDGGGETQPSAYRIERFSRLSFYTALSPLGLGEHVSTNVSPQIDLRLFGNYFSLNHSLTRSQVRIAANGEFKNVGALIDYYPFHKPFRFSPGFLFYNGNRIRVDLKGEQDAALTLNNIDFFSDNADPLRGTGRLTLGGTGFVLTAGYGRITSRSEKHFSFPFEAGVAFIDTPRATLTVAGQACSASGTDCQAAANFPGFANALAAELVTLNRHLAPLHTYPIVEGGVAYTFSLPRRRF